MMNDREGISPKFNLESYLAARKIAQKISLLCASHIDVGMTEQDGIEILDKLFEMHGIEKKWHPHKFRIGLNTTKSFREKSEPNIKLKKDDIYFLDIGPVIEGHEADIGHTYTIGQNMKFAHAQKTVKEIFMELQKEWKEEKLTGQSLYQRAKELTEKKGYVLNDKMQGHRLGDFPHALFYKGKLSDFEKHPIKNLWVLELLIRDPSGEFGAFYEDILI